MVRQKGTKRAFVHPAVDSHKKRLKARAGHTHWNRNAPIPQHLVAKPAIAKSKHETYYEIADNTDKKKKLEYELTDRTQPSANFTFIPIGNPELTNACKEFSREEGALIYVVSANKEDEGHLGQHVHRLGYHFRSGIVERAAASIGAMQYLDSNNNPFYSLTSPDVIPKDQEDINKQADAAIRDLFPRVPNTDREMIVRHAFQKGAMFKGKPVVGLQEDLSLSRRVQLAVLAHIRHTHTRYDELLRETSWENARRAVESLCLDIIIKWRGDEETGRDQLDEVLREVVVISDTEEDDSDDEGDDEDSSSDEDEEVTPDKDLTAPPAVVQRSEFPRPTIPAAPRKRAARVENMHTTESERESVNISSRLRSRKNKPRKERRNRKGLKRYDKRFDTAWKDAVNRRKFHRDLDAPVDNVAQTSMPGQHPMASVTVPAPMEFQRPLRVYNEDPLDDSIPATAQKQRPVQRQAHHPPRKRIAGHPVSYNELDRVQRLESGQYQQNRQSDENRLSQAHHGHHSSTQSSLPNNSFRRTHQSLDQSIGRIAQDQPLPSIEAQHESSQAGLASEGYYGRVGEDIYKEQRYVEDGIMHNQSASLSRPEIVYLDDYENQPKRRRVIEDHQRPFVEPIAAWEQQPGQFNTREQHTASASDIQSRLNLGSQPGHPIYIDDRTPPRRRRIVRVITVPSESEPPPFNKLSLNDEILDHPGRQVRDPQNDGRLRFEQQRHNESGRFPHQLERYDRRPPESGQPAGLSSQRPQMNYQPIVAPDQFPSLSLSSSSGQPHHQDGGRAPFSYQNTIPIEGSQGPLLSHNRISSYAPGYHQGHHRVGLSSQGLAPDDRDRNTSYGEGPSQGSRTPGQPQYNPSLRENRGHDGRNEHPLVNLGPHQPHKYREVRRPDGVIILDH